MGQITSGLDVIRYLGLPYSLSTWGADEYRGRYDPGVVIPPRGGRAGRDHARIADLPVWQ